MAKTTRKPTKETYRTSKPPSTRHNHHQQQQQQQQPAAHQLKAEKQTQSWTVMKNILTCKHLQVEQQQPQQQQRKQQQKQELIITTSTSDETTTKKSKKLKCSGSLCNNTKVMHRPELSSPEVLHKKRAAAMTTPSSSSSSSSFFDRSNRSMKAPSSAEVLGNAAGNTSSKRSTVSKTNSASSSDSYSVSNINNSNRSNNSNIGSSSTTTTSSVPSFKGMAFGRFSGCYECRMVVDPVLGFTRDPSLRATIYSCPQCGEVFMKPENLELHQAVRHAVSELGPEDTSKNIVEIIFQSSWLKKTTPVCKIDRILKVHNTQKTILKFEEYRDYIKSKAIKHPKKHPRCIADGNELLRFHSTTFKCSLGLNNSSNLCNSIPQCNVCSIIKNGFKISSSSSSSSSEGGVGGKGGILSTATSGRAHDMAEVQLVEGGGEDDRRAMLVCRVIAGRVKKGNGGCVGVDEYDSVAGVTGVYSNLDELYVFNAKAILPCFVVIYRGFN